MQFLKKLLDLTQSGVTTAILFVLMLLGYKRQQIKGEHDRIDRARAEQTNDALKETLLDVRDSKMVRNDVDRLADPDVDDRLQQNGWTRKD